MKESGDLPLVVLDAVEAVGDLATSLKNDYGLYHRVHAPKVCDALDGIASALSDVADALRTVAFEIKEK